MSMDEQKGQTVAKKWWLFSIVGIVSLALDLGTKYWAKASLSGDGTAVSVIDNFWDWQLAFNRGSAFSMFTGQWLFLTVVGVIALFAVFWMLHQAGVDQKLNHWALGLIAGGAIGNLGERIVYREVTDFVVWRYYEHRWPTFNIADMCLVIGVCLLLVDSFRPATKARIAAEKAEKLRKKREKRAKRG